MVYAAYEARRALLAPLQISAARGTAMLEAVGDAGVPMPLAGVSRAALGTFSALQLTHRRPEFGIESVEREGERVAITEETVLTLPFGSLRRFAGDDGRDLPKVLIVPGLAGHFATLVRHTIRAMLADHDVYVADWHNARDVPVGDGRFGLDEYVEHIIDFLDATGPGTQLMAVCQPCVAALTAAAIMAEDSHPAEPAGVILLAGPVDARINPGPVNEFAEKQSLAKLERFAVMKVPRPHAGAGRRVYPGFLQVSGFLGMAPRRHIDAFGSLFGDLARNDVAGAVRTQEFYAEYFAVLDIAAEFYLETARVIFQDHDFARGEMTWRGRRVDPAAIGTALMTIEGEKDEFCPPGQTAVAQALCTGIPKKRRVEHLQAGVGHYGVFSGSRFDAEIYPKIRAFIAA
jgi:poly(3-hydroxybutyrate) depolymerase